MEADKTTVLPLAPNLIPKRGEFRFKREAEGAWRRKECEKDIPSGWILTMVSLSLFRDGAWRKKEVGGGGAGSGDGWSGVGEGG